MEGAGIAGVAGMHAVSFVAKRMHLRTVAYGQVLVRQVHGMTPARFDLLTALCRREDWVDPIYGPRKRFERFRRITTLARELGLHRSTVSKMVKRLVEMGWLRREREYADARNVVVAITELGWKSFDNATHLSERPMRREMARCFTPRAIYWKQVDRVVARVVAEGRRRARFFGDRALLLYDVAA